MPPAACESLGRPAPCCSGLPHPSTIRVCVQLVVDEQLKPVPVGIPGEICFGSCVARGYLHSPELTAEKFVRNPLWSADAWRSLDQGNWFGKMRMSGEGSLSEGAAAMASPDGTSATTPGPMQCNPNVPPAPILYRTGDLAVVLPSGDLRFCGRLDRQVKVCPRRELNLALFPPSLPPSLPPLCQYSPPNAGARLPHRAGGGRGGPA